MVFWTLILLFVMLGVTIAVALWVLANAKDFLLSNVGIDTGVFFATVAGTFLFCVIALLGYLFSRNLGISMGVGVFVGIIVGAYVFNRGLFENAARDRSVMWWFGEAVPGYEAPGGIGWCFNFFGAVSATGERHTIKEDTLSKDGFLVETNDDTPVPTDATINWIPRAGALYYYGRMQKLLDTLLAQMASFLRIYGEKQPDVDSYVGSQTKLEDALRIHLNRMSEGKRGLYTIDDKGNVTYTSDDIVEEPWGVQITSTVIDDFHPPRELLEASSEILAAERRKTVARTQADAIEEVATKLRAGGKVNANAALAVAASTVLPEGDTGLKVNAFAGLTEAAEALGRGIGAGLALRGTPTNNDKKE